MLGYSRQKILKLKEDIRIFSDDKMTYELFRIKQQQIIDAWGKFSVIDSATITHLGYFKRLALKSGFVKDEWEMYDPWDRMIGKVSERTGRGLLRKYVPFGNIVPEKVYLEYHGQEVAEIKQQFKIIGDIWEVDCSRVGPDLDRRVLIGCILLMSMIERSRK